MCSELGLISMSYQPFQSDHQKKKHKTFFIPEEVLSLVDTNRMPVRVLCIPQEEFLNWAKCFDLAVLQNLCHLSGLLDIKFSMNIPSYYICQNNNLDKMLIVVLGNDESLRREYTTCLYEKIKESKELKASETC